MTDDTGKVPGDALLTSGDVAALFGVSPKTVRRWAEAGKLSVIRTPGGHRRYRAEQVYDLRNQAFDDRE